MATKRENEHAPCSPPSFIPTALFHTHTYHHLYPHFQIPLKPVPLTTFHYRFRHAFPHPFVFVLHELEPPCKRLAAHLSVPCSHYPQFISHELITLSNPLPYSSPYLSYQPCPSNLTTFPLSTSSYPFPNHPTNPFLILCPYHPCYP